MLKLENISRRFGETVALDDLSLELSEGEILGFVGANGAGKTTAMRIAVGVLEPDSGTVHWQGREIDESARALIGYMPEERGLYPKMRVRDHLVYLARLHGADVSEAVDASQMWLDRLGISDRSDSSVESLSLGNQQRVQLAAALVHDPRLLILDEPFSGLDPVGVDVLAEVLVEVARERDIPVIFSSHQLELVERLCDRVVIVDRGRLVADESLDGPGGLRGSLVERFRTVAAR